MKNSIFGAIVAVVVCGCIFAILCVTNVISFNKDDDKSNITNTNTTQKEVKETKLCERAKTIDGNQYRFAVYKIENGETNNKIDFLVNGKSIYTDYLDYYDYEYVYGDASDGSEKLIDTKAVCESHFNRTLKDNQDAFTVRKITSDNSYNYYLYTMPYLNNIAISENKATKEFKYLKDFGYNSVYGVVTYETYQAKPENMQCLDRQTIDIVDDYVSVIDLKGDLSTDTITEDKYIFKNGNIEKVNSNQKYVIVCNTPW